jgi:soluble lytic murein transglycosylase-like protein
MAGCVAFAAGSDSIGGQFEKIYDSSDNASLTAWGRRYEHGGGVAANVARAIRLYCKAATQGHADAQYRLGWIYAHGRGAKRDDRLAAAWFERAARQNHLQARNLLKLLGVKPKSTTSCPTGSAWRTSGKQRFRPKPPPAHLSNLVRSLAPEFRLDPKLVVAVIQVESNFDPNARSPKNAQGLMQLIPETAKRFGVKDVWDPEQNVRGGMAYLRWLLDNFEGDTKLALAGYNAGERAVQLHGGIPPFEETQDYVRLITGLLDR